MHDLRRLNEELDVLQSSMMVNVLANPFGRRHVQGSPKLTVMVLCLSMKQLQHGWLLAPSLKQNFGRYFME